MDQQRLTTLHVHLCACMCGTWKKFEVCLSSVHVQCKTARMDISITSIITYIQTRGLLTWARNPRKGVRTRNEPPANKAQSRSNSDQRADVLRDRHMRFDGPGSPHG